MVLRAEAGGTRQLRRKGGFPRLLVSVHQKRGPRKMLLEGAGSERATKEAWSQQKDCNKQQQEGPIAGALEKSRSSFTSVGPGVLRRNPSLGDGRA